MVFKFNPHTVGGNIHVNVYVSPSLQSTFSSLGQLVFSRDDWTAWCLLMARANDNPNAFMDKYPLRVISIVETDAAENERRRQEDLQAERNKAPSGRAKGTPEPETSF